MNFNFDPELRHRVFHLIEDSLKIIKAEKERLRDETDTITITNRDGQLISPLNTPLALYNYQ